MKLALIQICLTNSAYHNSCLSPDLLDIVHPILGRGDPFPAGGQTLRLQRVTPVGGLGVVIDVILSIATQSKVHRPTWGQWHWIPGRATLGGSGRSGGGHRARIGRVQLVNRLSGGRVVGKHGLIGGITGHNV